ncbi:hypothetical protein EVJ27_11850 [Exiguobacterium sp. SH3S2]|uniref:hypothetical protein n=1 Tax=unclassified Exiguobacterium TaxID=2644629 RepID=UPI00103BBFE1|nr:MULTISPECIES: hypothetical protein [unclassified Exiguobacterium]TCI24371.1 hypothetical protein EVJ32_14495 [Exiguobacterium sp. SH5S4]TCI42931.1 hypothetical protein EVJ28_11870 [Exiguobacterium sp. SH3S3]TCI56141.1 hypothetical protein EVJ30_04440 [Exiguobacterium sp. SH5S13]TCI58684.1 hypothetical protein EVJ27_11850 [Exiguobacterium sp. SH3S2]TCI61723.1 hypothetical protein EVJ26_09175 [Exiguobacterium sp. SH3S1]
MSNRLEQERTWVCSFQQLMYGIVGMFLVVILPIVWWTDSLFWGIVYMALVLVPVNVMYIRRYQMRQRLNPKLTHRYRQQLGSDMLNTVAFFIALNGNELLGAKVFYTVGLLVIVLAGWMTMRIDKRMKQEDVWRSTYKEIGR